MLHEVTFREWDACRRDGGCSHTVGDRGWGRGDRPVIDVSWHDAKEYTRWLSRKTGAEYRLLSESEWEYAVRAGTTGPFHFGSTISPEEGNYTYGSGRKGRYWRRKEPVGSFPPNAFGLHDVHGNVREWVEDCWHDRYRGAPSDGDAWTRGGDCGKRVLRGGAWVDDPRSLRSAIRYSFTTGNRYFYAGFRVARTLDWPLNLRLLASLAQVQGAESSDRSFGPVRLLLGMRETGYEFRNGDGRPREAVFRHRQPRPPARWCGMNAPVSRAVASRSRIGTRGPASGRLRTDD